ncbi:MAG: replication-associated recombination protein A [Vampirovibrionales bacterium]|nr:replication-associated recombination protein A [Vampirovibrionales bacterium]
MTQPPLLQLLAEQNRQSNQQIPLAERLRPQTLNDVYGQHGVLAPGQPLHTMLLQHELTSLLFWGPPGVGKTTLARLICTQANAHFETLSAVNSGLKELRDVIDRAKNRLGLSGERTALFIDEIHRYSKTQQDALLPVIEDGTLTLIGATTENPAFQVIPALRSRLLLIRLQPLTEAAMAQVLHRGVQALAHAQLTEDAQAYLVRYANGDARSALTLLEVAYKSTLPEPDSPQRIITVARLEQLGQQSRLNYDEDAHYDHASAYQKSMRGSDADAALYWLAKMITGGEDPRFIARRLLITAAEDVGLADPQALVIAQAAAETVQLIGLPEARIALAMATAYVAKAPKSNAALRAIDAALADIQTLGKNYPVPMHLRDAHYAEAKAYGHGSGYIYTHQHPEAHQTFLPQALLGTRYLDS